LNNIIITHHVFSYASYLASKLAAFLSPALTAPVLLLEQENSEFGGSII
jgi:hypothetical protein